MTQYTEPVGQSRGVIYCDAAGCTMTVEAIAGTSFAAYDKVREHARAAGWNAWASRSTRHYCRDHGPKPGHKMRHLWGDER